MESPATNININDGRIQLLPFEQNFLVDSFIDDVLFIVARGLGLERLFLNHLHLYSDSRNTVLVINTSPEDEHFFLEKVKTLNPDCPPKLITSEVPIKDRIHIYKSGGVQFVTSRILMVDLLSDRIPFERVAGILVYRAHTLLTGFQESFILRLFREKKRHGFVKAFTENSTSIVGHGAGGLGQLQRLLGLLYVKRVIIVPRFHAEVKSCFDTIPLKLTQLTVQLDACQKKAQVSLRDIISTCVRELKNCTKEFDAGIDSDTLAPSATLRITKLEIELKKRARDISLSDRQKRLLSDLDRLRRLFTTIEELDPTIARRAINAIRSDKEVVANNSGWLFTQSAATLFSNIEELCSQKDPEGNRTIAAPSKWSIFCTILEEIEEKLITENSDFPVLVLVSSENLARQLIDLVKFGRQRYTWMLTRNIVDLSRRDSLALAPPLEPLWNPVNLVHYDAQLLENDRQNLRDQLRIQQKDVAREMAKQPRKRGSKLDYSKQKNENESKQARLDQFGILPFAAKSNKTTFADGKQKTNMRVAQRSSRKMVREPKSSNGLPSNNVEREPADGILPEDPLTSFYEHEEGSEMNPIVEDNCPSPSTPIVVVDNIDANNLQECGRDRSFSPPSPLRAVNDNDVNADRNHEPIISRYYIEGEARPAETSIAKIFRARQEDVTHIDVLDEFAMENGDELLSAAPAKPSHSLKSMLVFIESQNRYRLINCIETLRPRFVIMYSTDIASTRVLEMFKALNPEHPLELSALMYSDSSEEERYLSTIQNESEAFETLIKEQGVLLVPREYDIARDSFTQLRRLAMQQRADSRNKRAGGMRQQSINEADEIFETEIRPLVIVDMREFNSELPTVLYRRGIDLQAATLEIGDYILSPEICIERKSLDDLIQSILSGRIYNQLKQMMPHYKKCILLIESSEKYRSKSNKSGAFQGDLSRQSREVRKLFVTLIKSFPRLNLIWSVSPAHSAELFEELKLDQPNPEINEVIVKKRDRQLQ